MAKNIFATFGIFALLLISMGMANAAESENSVSIILNQTSISNVSEGDVYSVIATIENLNTTDFYVSFRLSNWNSWTPAMNVTNGTSENFTGAFTIPASLGSRGLYADIYNVSNNSELLFTIDTTIALNYYVAPTITPPEEQTACEFDQEVNESGDLKITDFSMSDLGNGDDDLWQYMDKIEFEVEVENRNNNDYIRDVEVKAIIMAQDSEGNWTEDVTSDFDLDDDIITSMGKIREHDKESVVFSIPELPSDITEGNYRLYIIAYSNVDEVTQCTSKYHNSDFTKDLYFEFGVEGVDYEDSIIVKNSFLDTTIDTSCGAKNVEVTIPIYNLYDEREDMILVNIYNSELGIDKYETIEDLRDGRHKEVTFFIDIPKGLDKDTYKLDIYVNFDWDNNEDELSEYSYAEKTTEAIDVKILSCNAIAPSIKPILESETTKGTELVVKTLITNNGEDNNFAISASGYESWAKLISITPESALVNEGEFIEATVVLMPIKSGVQSFKISTTIGDETFNQPVSVNIKEAANIFGLSGNVLYLSAGIAGILILILVILIVKVASKKPTKAKF